MASNRTTLSLRKIGEEELEEELADDESSQVLSVTDIPIHLYHYSTFTVLFILSLKIRLAK